jgi:hypothetical protein
LGREKLNASAGRGTTKAGAEKASHIQVDAFKIIIRFVQTLP